MGLVARILGGGERQESQPTEARPGTPRSKGAGQEARDREGRQGDGGPAWKGRHDGIRRSS